MLSFDNIAVIVGILLTNFIFCLCVRNQAEPVDEDEAETTDAAEHKRNRAKLIQQRLEFRRVALPGSKERSTEQPNGAEWEVEMTSKKRATDRPSGAEGDLEIGDSATENTGSDDSESKSQDDPSDCDLETGNSTADTEIRGSDADDDANDGENSVIVTSPQVEPISSSNECKTNSNRRHLSSFRDFFKGVSVVNKPATVVPNQECCSICLEAYAAEDVVARLKPHKNGNQEGSPAVQCTHWFHKECILEWLQNHHECPLCRVDMISE